MKVTEEGAAADLPEGFKMTELGPLPEEWEVVQLDQEERAEADRVVDEALQHLELGPEP